MDLPAVSLAEGLKSLQEHIRLLNKELSGGAKASSAEEAESGQ